MRFIGIELDRLSGRIASALKQEGEPDDVDLLRVDAELLPFFDRVSQAYSELRPNRI
jgi:hypothetical protein